MERFAIRYLIPIHTHWKKLVLVLCVFCFYSGSTLQAVRYYGGSLYEYVLLSITDQYYFMFFSLPLFLYFIIRIFSSASVVVICRYRHFYQYFIHQVWSVLIFTAVYTLAPTVCISVTGLLGGLPLQPAPTVALLETESFGTILGIYQTHFASAPVAIGAAVIYLLIGFLFISVSVVFLMHMFSKKTVAIFVVVIYILAVFGVQKGSDEIFPYLFLNNYFVISHALSKGQLWLFIIIMIVGISLILLSLKKHWRWRKQL